MYKTSLTSATMIDINGGTTPVLPMCTTTFATYLCKLVQVCPKAHKHLVSEILICHYGMQGMTLSFETVFKIPPVVWLL